MYFDLHLHPSFKPFLTDEKDELKDNCWEKFPNAINIIRSQSCLDQLSKGKVNLAVASIYAMERGFSVDVLIRIIAPKLSMLNKDFLTNISQGIYSYHDLFIGEIEHLRRNQNFQEKSFTILNNMNEFEEDKLNLVLAIEGGHCLGGREGQDVIMENLESLKKKNVRFLYLTLTHLTQYSLSTHAYGMKFLSGDVFKPSGKGLTQKGKNVVDLSYEYSEDFQRILIDVKHMSLQARQEFYKYREENQYTNIPIIASHMGLTGLSWTELENHIKEAVREDSYVKVAYDNKPTGLGKKIEFNPWSINLYDEDIKEIISSGGLIGLSLDQRILGACKLSEEYFSHDEFIEIAPEVQLADGIKYAEKSGVEALMKNEDYELEFDQYYADRGIPTINTRKHIRHLANHILHIIKVAGSDGWKHICIGSDFDGLINPINIDISTSAADYPVLEKKLIKHLKDLIEEAKQKNSDLDFSEGNLSDHVRDIMFNNAFWFLEKWL